MSPFKSAKQRRWYFRNKPSRSPPLQPPPPHIGISKNSILSKTTMSDRLIWTGCSFAIPTECLVIKGVYTAYKMYKQESLNKQYDNKIEKIVREMPKFTSTVAEDEINKVSKEIVNQVNDSGLINNISKNTKINENIIKNFMEGTISNVLKDKIEIGTGFLVNNVIL